MKYVTLILDTEEGLRRSPSEREAWMAEIMSWYDKWTGAGKVVDGGHQLDRPDKARTIRAGAVTDGPYMEAKEVLGGFSVLEADTIDEAVDVARTWPGVDQGWITIEVRPVMAG